MSLYRKRRKVTFELIVKGFGIPEAYVKVGDSPPVKVSNWQGQLVRELFYFLVHHPVTSRDEIFSTFWPGLSVKDATNVFHVTKRKMNEVLARAAGVNTYDLSLTDYTLAFYMLSANISYDVMEFERTYDKQLKLKPGERSKEDLDRLLEQIGKGQFLQGETRQWVLEERERLNRRAANVYYWAALEKLEVGDREKAVLHLENAYALHPRDDIAKEYVRLAGVVDGKDVADRIKEEHIRYMRTVGLSEKYIEKWDK